MREEEQDVRFSCQWPTSDFVPETCRAAACSTEAVCSQALGRPEYLSDSPQVACINGVCLPYNFGKKCRYAGCGRGSSCVNDVCTLLLQGDRCYSTGVSDYCFDGLVCAEFTTPVCVPSLAQSIVIALLASHVLLPSSSRCTM